MLNIKLYANATHFMIYCFTNDLMYNLWSNV